MARGQKQLMGADENIYDSASSNDSKQQTPVTLLQQSDDIDYLVG